MIDLKGFGRKWSWHNFKPLFRHSPVGVEEIHGKPQLGQPVSVLRFEPEIYRILSRNVNHSITTFDP
jgi:hypothetical protein